MIRGYELPLNNLNICSSLVVFDSALRTPFDLVNFFDFLCAGMRSYVRESGMGMGPHMKKGVKNMIFILNHNFYKLKLLEKLMV